MASPALGTVTALALLVTSSLSVPSTTSTLCGACSTPAASTRRIWVCRHRDHPWLASTRLIGVLSLLLAALVLWELRHPIPVAFSIQELLREGRCASTSTRRRRW